MRRTVEQKTLEGFLNLEFCIEDDKPEGHREDIVASPALEIVSEHVQRVVVALLALDWWQMRSGPPASGSASEDPRRVWG